MRTHLADRKGAFLGAVIVISLMSGYEAGAMMSVSQSDSPKLAATAPYDTCASANPASDETTILATGSAIAATDCNPARHSNPVAKGANSHVYVTRKMACRHPHHAHSKAANLQDFDFGYAFGGSGLD